MHAVVGEQWLLTVHTESCPAFIGLRKRTMLGGPLPSTAVLMNRIADSLADSFYPELERIDDRVDEMGTSCSATTRRTSWPRCSACGAGSC